MSEQLTVAAVVVFIAISPTWVDAFQIWKHPDKYVDGVEPKQIQTALVVWYLLLLFVALSAWRMFS